MTVTAGAGVREEVVSNKVAKSSSPLSQGIRFGNLSDPMPARSCVEVSALAGGAEIEIELIAACCGKAGGRSDE